MPQKDEIRWSEDRTDRSLPMVWLQRYVMAQDEPRAGTSSPRPEPTVAREEHLIAEGRRMSIWAVLGAIIFVILMVALAFGVFMSGGPTPTGTGRG
ncbi:hypothetical protein ASE04_20870 [Rhizobium sp. Root708]|nr:hypothetical protein ASE04_20870 [Rhizobium sp. Root708]